MANVRITTGRRSREVGSQVGIQLNVFALDKLRTEINGPALSAILLEAAQPMLEHAQENWPVDTGASRDSVELGVVEEAEHRARVVLQAGGQKLINDPRNKAHIDYAPYLELGTAGRPAYACIRNAVYDSDVTFRRNVHDGVKSLIEKVTR